MFLELESSPALAQFSDVSKTIAVIVLSLAALSCGGFGVGAPEGAFNEVPGNPTWNEHIVLVMARACDECHGVGQQLVDGFVTSSYDDAGGDAGVFKLRNLIVERSVDLDPSQMPPAPRKTLTPVEQETLVLWVEQGAPRGADPEAEP